MRKKFAIFLFITILGVCILIPLYIYITNYSAADSDRQINIIPMVKETSAKESSEGYSVYIDGELSGEFSSSEEAYNFAKNMKHAAIKKSGMTNLIWDNYPEYNVFNDIENYNEFERYEDALEFAKSKNMRYIFSHKSNNIVWDSEKANRVSFFLDNVPHIAQNPELPKGCEVTALAMLLNYAGIKVDKLTLAEQIKKNPDSRTFKNGKIYAGDPNDGFVGDMWSKNKFGLGVYHKPVFELLKEYLPDKAADLTGSEFSELYKFIDSGSPVWIIINSRYRRLPASEFEEWVTPNGIIQITYREHAVLITGYDEKNIYFNDPLSGKRNAAKNNFIEAWEQMGKQAIGLLMP